MLPLSSLFGTSPFTPLIRHMESVYTCVQEILPLTEAFIEGDTQRIEAAALKISELEHASDIIKNDIRNALSGTLFLSVDKSDLLEILEAQDLIADAVEDVSVLMTLRKLVFIHDLQPHFTQFVKKNLETFSVVYDIVQELPGLNEASFSGIEAEKVKLMTTTVSELEHEADLIQRELLKCLFHHDKALTPGMFHQWQKIFETIGMIANSSERLALAIRMTIDTTGL